jgi:hypothetical protein
MTGKNVLGYQDQNSSRTMLDAETTRGSSSLTLPKLSPNVMLPAVLMICASHSSLEGEITTTTTSVTFKNTTDKRQRLVVSCKLEVHIGTPITQPGEQFRNLQSQILART